MGKPARSERVDADFFELKVNTSVPETRSVE